MGSWSQLLAEVKRLLQNSRTDVLTTVFDYYGFPADAPGMAGRPTGGARSRAEHVEAAIAAAVGDPRFLPHLALHETEGWVYAAAKQLGELVGSPALGERPLAEATAAGGPECVNDGVQTAPSKRLLGYWPRYEKLVHGPLALEMLGIDALRERCPHLDAWLRRFEG